jgi:hypothetical protein
MLAGILNYNNATDEVRLYLEMKSRYATAPPIETTSFVPTGPKMLTNTANKTSGNEAKISTDDQY